jgi:hypothetical protein
MANYEIDARVLQPHVPAGVELDTFNGKHWISVVGLRFVDTRVLGVPVPFHRNFEEINLRIYVRRNLNGERRRAVVFIRELVPRRWVAWTARAIYGENYGTVPMGHVLDAEGSDGSGFRGIRYTWGRRGGECRLSAKVEGNPSPILPGSEEEFIADHEWGYARRGAGVTFEYRVEHPSWPLWRPSEMRLEGDLSEYYGPEIASFLTGPPASAFVADGSAVRVYPRRRVRVEGA